MTTNSDGRSQAAGYHKLPSDGRHSGLPPPPFSLAGRVTLTFEEMLCDDITVTQCAHSCVRVLRPNGS